MIIILVFLVGHVFTKTRHSYSDHGVVAFENSDLDGFPDDWSWRVKLSWQRQSDIDCQECVKAHFLKDCRK